MSSLIPSAGLDTASAAIVAGIEAKSRKERTPCGDGSIVWRVWGAGEPLLLLHGGSGSWRHWVRNIEPLSRHFELWVPDIPGLGDSAMPPEPRTPMHIAEIMGAGLEELFPAGPEAASGRLLVRRAGRGHDGGAGRGALPRADPDRGCRARTARRSARAVRQDAHRHEPRGGRGVSPPEPRGADVRRPAQDRRAGGPSAGREHPPRALPQPPLRRHRRAGARAGRRDRAR